MWSKETGKYSLKSCKLNPWYNLYECVGLPIKYRTSKKNSITQTDVAAVQADLGIWEIPSWKYPNHYFMPPFRFLWFCLICYPHFLHCAARELWGHTVVLYRTTVTYIVTILVQSCFLWNENYFRKCKLHI